MSLHAQLSPAARERYARQRRSSSLASVTISLLSMILLGLILAILALEIPAASPPGVIIHHGERPEDDPPRPREVNLFQNPTPAPGGSASRFLVVNAATDLAVPVVDALPTESVPFGEGDGFDLGIGDDTGFPPGGPGKLPSDFGKRCDKQDRLRRLQETGGPLEVEDAVVNALRWLKNHQNADGSWGAANKVGMTGLALLAYLGHCETPLSEEFGESCTDAIVFLLDIAAKNSGKLATDFQDRHWPYQHAIATYALAEALSFSNAFPFNIPGHREAVQSAGQWIIDNQHESGGWDYSYEESSSRGGDLSITGWHLQALKACKSAGVEFRNLASCVRHALDYVEARQDSSGGFGYTGTAPAGGLEVHSLTGVGTLSFQLWDKASHRAARKGIRYLRQHAALDYDGPQSDLYAHYYHSQALMQHGGPAWDEYNQTLASQLLAAQADDGSFARPGGGGNVAAAGPLFAQDNVDGLVYRNCLCTLMLEVYYRYLPGTGS